MNAPTLHAIPETGIVHGLSNDDYHRHPARSKSQLSDFLVCPANYWMLHEAPDRPIREETPSMRTGTLVHTLTLEPDTFDHRYAVGPDAARNTKEWKSWEALQMPGKTLIKPDEYNAALAMANSLRSHTEIADLLAAGVPEASAFWKDDETGLALRCRPDWLHETGDGWIILDVKTTSDRVSAEAFGRTCASYGYGLQAAMYAEGVAKATGKPVVAFVFGVVSTSYPYLSSCCMLDDDSIAASERLYRRTVRAFADAKAKNEWPGYRGVQLVRLPAWSLAEQE